MQTYVMRLDIELEANEEEDVGKELNRLIHHAKKTIDLKHFQWKICEADGGLLDPDLEKMMANAIMLPEKNQS